MSLRTVLYHELGHTFDLLVLNKRERTKFKRIIGIRRRGWFSGVLPPSEWFADGYKACAIRTRVRRRARATFYGYAPRKRQHARVCGLIRDAAAPKGRRPRRPKNPPKVIEVPPPPPEPDSARLRLQRGGRAPHGVHATRATRATSATRATCPTRSARR